MDIKRINVSKRIRFEVFKRDSFTCQYCGGKAPEVILEVDHINPVSKGGKNELLNLISSCFDCNRGKSDKTLSDDSVIQKQRIQLESFQERKEQISMLCKWKESFANEKFIESDSIMDLIIRNIPELPKKQILSERKSILVLVQKHGSEKLIDYILQNSVKIKQEFSLNKDVKNILQLIDKKIYWESRAKSDPIQTKILYIRGILRKRDPCYFRDHQVIDLINDAIKKGVDLTYIESAAKKCTHFETFKIELQP